MPDILYDAIKGYLLVTDNLYLFTSASGAIMSKNSFRCFWDKIIRKVNEVAGGNHDNFVISKEITPHIFRHTYATMLYYAGIDIKMAIKVITKKCCKINISVS